MITRDRAIDGTELGVIAAQSLRSRDHAGEPFARPIQTRDGRFVDGSGAFLVGELERLDQTMHMPLFSYKYTRDLPLRTDVTIGDDVTSFTQSTFASPGDAGLGSGSVIGQKRSVIGKATTEIGEVAVDIGKVTKPLVPWAKGARYSILELESAAQTGRPIDQQQLYAIDSIYQMEMDNQAYLGWAANNTFGLINSTDVVTPTNFPNGVSGFSDWPRKTNNEILSDLAALLYAPYAASGFSVMPNRIGLDPENLSLITTQQVALGGTGGYQSILKYFLSSNIATNAGEDLKIVDMKWLVGAGEGGTLGVQGTTNRAIAYRYEPNWQAAPVRFPITMLQRTPIQYNGIFHSFYKYGKFGAVEMPYPELVAYRDGN